MIWQLRDLIKQKTVMQPLGKLANWDFMDLEKNYTKIISRENKLSNGTAVSYHFKGIKENRMVICVWICHNHD